MVVAEPKNQYIQKTRIPGRPFAETTETTLEFMHAWLLRFWTVPTWTFTSNFEYTPFLIVPLFLCLWSLIAYYCLFLALSNCCMRSGRCERWLTLRKPNNESVPDVLLGETNHEPVKGWKFIGNNSTYTLSSEPVITPTHLSCSQPTATQ